MRTLVRPSRRERGFRPTLFALEGRSLLSVITVDDDRKQRKDADFTSIQAAVLAADPGDKILVSPGTYKEQVTIPAGKDGLKLVSDKHWKATIQAPATLTGLKAIVEVDAHNVLIEGFTIAGPSPDVQVGVLIDQGGSATVRDNHITDIRNDPLSGGQQVYAVYVRHGMGTIVDNTIDHYQKNGVLVANADSFAEVAHNTVRGVGPTTVLAQNGIQISDGAKADVHDNNVSDNIYTGTVDNAAGGIILVNSGTGTKVRNNEVTRNDKGIALSGAINAIVTGNSVSRSTEDGISLLNGTTGSLIANNESRKNGLDGIFVDPTSTNNTIRNNELKQNQLFDAEDQSVGAGTAGTANTWQNNEGKTSSPPGLVQKKSDDHHDHDDDDNDDGPPKAHHRRHFHGHGDDD